MRFLLHVFFFTLILISDAVNAKSPKVQHKVRCSPKEMQVELLLTEDVSEVYLEGRKDLQELGCRPTIQGNTATFQLSLTDVFQCGVTKVVDKSNDHRLYYHRIVVEYTDDSVPKEVILAKCSAVAHRNQQQPDVDVHKSLVKRDTLPEGFQEEEIETLEITNVTGFAPEVVLGIAVRQNGQVVGSDLTVQPGTLLQMDIFLDPSSSSTYGLLVGYMDVTDNRNKEETIILNGCSVDPYLFENFNTIDGDTLSARFRAFKFPESNYVQFRGTIDVCLDRCEGIDCSNGVVGYGRKRRAVNEGKSKWRPNKVFEVTMMTVLKIQEGDEQLLLRKDVISSKSSPAGYSSEPALKPRAVHSADPQPAKSDPAANSAAGVSFLLAHFLLSWIVLPIAIF